MLSCVFFMVSSGFGGRGVLPGVATGTGLSPKSSKIQWWLNSFYSVFTVNKKHGSFTCKAETQNLTTQQGNRLTNPDKPWPFTLPHWSSTLFLDFVLCFQVSNSVHYRAWNYRFNVRFGYLFILWLFSFILFYYLYPFAILFYPVYCMSVYICCRKSSLKGQKVYLCWFDFFFRLIWNKRKLWKTVNCDFSHAVGAGGLGGQGPGNAVKHR